MNGICPAVVLSVVVTLAAASVPLNADTSLITPQPREMKLLGDPVSLDGGAIVLAGSHAKLLVAADEVNQRLKHDLKAVPLPVVRGGVESIGSAKGLTIVIGIVGTLEMAAVLQRYATPVPEKTQGYAISSHRRNDRLVMVLAGHDEQGALYAAVTFRHLLDPAEAAKLPYGRAVVQPALVRDWPDFVWQQIGRPPMNVGVGWELRSASKEGYASIENVGRRFVREGKQYVDFMLRHKINLSWTHATHLTASGDRQHPFLREVSDYASARGIAFVEKAHSNIGTYPRDKDDPIRSRCVDHRVHKQYFCWSLLDLHEQRAQVFAQAMKAAGIRWLYLHTTDGGGWENPARWEERCDECRRLYGDDHAAADAAVFGTWYRVMREAIPDFRMIAVVYPYNAASLAPDDVERRLRERSGGIPNSAELAQKIVDRNRSFLTRLGRLLPPDIFVCQRETLRNHYALMTECYGKRAFQIYLEQKHNRGWNPEFTIASGWLKTFYRPEHEDVFYASDCAWGHNYFSEMMSAEFGWNVDAPGAREFTNPSLRSRDIDHHIEPQEVTGKYLRRFCSDFYGPEIGPYMVPVYDSNLSYRFIQRPREVAGTMELDDAVAPMEATVAAASRAMASLQKAREIYDAAKAVGREPIPDELGARMFGEMYRAVFVSSHLAPYQLRMLQARAAVIAGDMDRAEELVAAMRDRVANGEVAWKAHLPWMRSLPIIERRNPNWVYTFGQFRDYDWAKLAEQVSEFEGSMDRLYQSYNTPKWFRKAMQERVLYAAPVKSAPTIDGRLDENAWQTAPPNQHFVDHQTSTPAERQTESRLLFDATGLYAGYTVYEPGADALPIETKDRNVHLSNSLHSVELFVDADGDKDTYTHYIWGIDGSVLGGKELRDANGRLKIGAAGFASKGKSAVARYPDRWTLEAWVPADELGGVLKSGKTWRANLCRNLRKPDRQRQSTSTVLMEGDSFHTPDKFARLQFLPDVPPPRQPVLTFEVETKTAEPCTIGDGTGYRLELNVALNTTKPLHHASLTAETFSGNVRQSEFAIFEDRTVGLLWRGREPVHHTVPTPEPGLYVDFRLASDEGTWTFTRKFGTPAPRSMAVEFVPGVSGQALNGTAWFAPLTDGDTLFDSQQGTLDMWVHVAPPLKTPLRFGPEPQYVLFCQSPLRYDHPLLDNTRSVCLRRFGDRMVGRVSTKEFQSVWAGATLADWTEAGWHHVAMQWSAAKQDQLAVEIFLDGRRVSRELSTNLHERVWHKKTESLVVQLGSMASGAGALGWPLDEVRVSSTPRYSGGFAPAKRAVLDGPATVVFHLDGDLSGETKAGEHSLTGGPGI